MPNNAEEWANFLVEKPLPSPFKVGQKVLRQLEREKLPYAKVAKIVNSDPILAFYVTSHANDTQTPNTPSSKTLTHAISMVGLEKLEDIIRHQPFKAISLKNITSFYYLRALSTSLYAGHLGRAISLRKKKGNPEDLYWSSLFVGAPIWYLWRFATPEMRLVRYAIRSNYKLPQTAEKEVLGDTMQDVTAALAKKLNLPDLASVCYQSDKQLSKRQWVQLARSFRADGQPLRIEDRDTAMLMQSPHFIVLLSNLIAHYATYCWYSRATLRAQRILACYLNCSLDEAIKLTHEAAADMSRAHPMPGVMQPAAKLFVPPRKRTKAKHECKLSHFQEETFSSPQQEEALANFEPVNKAPITAEDAVNSPSQSTKKPEREPVSESQTKPSVQAENKTTAEKSQPEQPKPEKIKQDTLEDNRTLPAQAKKQTEDHTTTAKPAAAPKTQGKAEQASNNTFVSDNPLFLELTQIMSHQPEEFKDLHELMNAATQGISYGIGLKRACVGLVSKDCSRFKNYYSVGCQGSEELKSFESKIVSKTIFEKLVQRPASVWIKPSSAKKILALIPMNFKSAADVNEFFLMSVFVGKKPVAIFYADTGGEQALTEKEYHLFKYLCSCVTSALQHQANKKSSKM